MTTIRFVVRVKDNVYSRRFSTQKEAYQHALSLLKRGREMVWIDVVVDGYYSRTIAVP